PARGQRAPRTEGAGGSRPRRLRAGEDRRLGGLYRRPDPGVRAGRRAGGRLRRRLVADPRRERLHGRHRAHRRAVDGQGGPLVPPERAPRAGRVAVKVLWDVDTQVDFMLPDGKLYIPGAEQTIPAMARLVQGAREAGLVHVASADDHELTDDEISDQPDFRTTYPPHCLRGTRGARKIRETEQD